jgi:hypothetical protein
MYSLNTQSIKGYWLITLYRKHNVPFETCDSLDLALNPILPFSVCALFHLKSQFLKNRMHLERV